MNNLETIDLIRKNIQPGDILLSREKDSPISCKINEKICGYWESAFLYLGDEKILTDHIIHINKLPIIVGSDCLFSIFRVKPELTKQEINSVILYARNLSGLKPTWWDKFCYFINRILKRPGSHLDVDYRLITSTLCSGTEIIASSYESVGKKLKPLYPWNMTPSDLDDSEFTVRIV